MRTLVTIVVFSLTHFGFSQFQVEPDTVYYNNSPLSNLDSSDIQKSDYASVIDGGFSLMNGSSFSGKKIMNRILGHGIAEDNMEFQPYRFSAIPYLGFTFGFGAQGSTNITANYAQAFSDSALLNINYVQSASSGYLRNSNFKKNNLQVRYRNVGRVYSSRLDAGYFKGVYFHCGGLLDTIIPGFGLEFQRVAKKNANSEFVNGRVDFQQYLDLIPGTSNALGLKFRHIYSIHNRVYNEIDTLSGIYDHVYYNADTTADQYNLASIENGAGVFYSRKGFTIEGVTSLRYWSYLNFDNIKDSVEWNVRAMTNLEFSKMKISGSAYINLLGAYNEWMTSGRMQLRFSDKSSFEARMETGAVAPDQFQRFYLANNYQYQLDNIKTQGVISIGGRIDQVIKDSTVNLSGIVHSMTLANPYIFEDSIWRNDTIDAVSILGISIKGDVQFWKMAVQPNLNYYISNAGFIPDYLIGARILFQARLFSSKKLAFVGGVDLSYRSSISSMSYIPSLDVFDYSANSALAPSRENLHVFANFGVKDFSFYIRAENLAYFWKSESILEMKGYPITPWRLKVGLTWEFFN